MVEIIYDGNAQIISEIEGLEPFDVAQLFSEIRQRSACDFGSDVDSWCNWFLSDCEEVTEETRITFMMLKRNKEQTDYFVEKLGGGLESNSPGSDE